jgi:hypothetical protein
LIKIIFKTLVGGVVFLMAMSSILASVLVVNFAQSDVSVEEGMTIYKYEDELVQTLNDKADFDGEVYSDGQFEAGKSDLEAVDSGDDYLTLNHYGDNAPDTSAVDWWDDDADSATKYNWRYRRCYTLDHTDGSAVTQDEYQVLFEFESVSLVSAGKMDVDGDDIRFVDKDGNVMDHYLVYGMNTGNTQAWVQMDSIAAGETEEVCMYYGYVGVGSPTNISDAESVFSYSSQKDLYYAVTENADGFNTAIGSYLSGSNSNQVDYGSYSHNFDQYEVVDNINVRPQSTPISAEGALMVSFENDAADAAVPIGYAGTEFIGSSTRYVDGFSFVAPFGAASVDVYESIGGTFVSACATVNVAAGGASSVVCDIANGSAYRIVSDVPILAVHGTDDDNDAHHLYPVEKAYQSVTGEYELWGGGSNDLKIAAGGECLGVEIFRSDNVTSLTVDLNAANNYSTVVSTGGTQGQSTRYRVVSDCAIGASEISDGDGNDEVILLPPREFSHEFLITQNTQYVSGAPLSQSLACRLYDDNNILLETDTSTGGDGLLRPSETYFPNTDLTTNAERYSDGYRVECDEPIYAYYENYDADLILLSLVVNTDDQTNFLGWPQGRLRAEVEPILEEYGTTLEEGLYYESGFADGEGSVVELDPILWLDASDINGDGTTLLDGVAVEEWYDKSYRKNNVLDVSGRGIPLKQFDGGRDVVEFTTDSMESIEALFPSLPATDVTWFMVSRTRTVSDGYAFVTDSNALGDRFGTHLPFGDGIWHSDFDCCGDGRLSVAWGGNTSDYFLWNARHSSTTGKELRRNASTVASGGVNTTGSNSPFPITLGSSDTDTNHQQINISELVIFDKDLSSEEVIAVENYLRNKWNVAAAGLEVDPQAYLEWTIDGSSFTNADHTFWDKVEWEEVVSDRTEENSTDSVLVEVGYADDTPSCAGATYYTTVLYESEISSSVDISPSFSDETTYNKYVKLLDSMSDFPCLRVRVYLQTGDEAYAPRLNNISVKYREAEFLEDQLNNPSVAISGNDGVDYGADRVRILKIVNSNTGLVGSTCELLYDGVSNSGVFTEAGFEFVDVGDGNIEEAVVQFDFPPFPGAPPVVGSGESVVCDDSEEVGVYFNHIRTGGGVETFDMVIDQDINALGGPLNEREFDLNVGGV